MADDTYPEELYVAEIEIFDYDDFYYWEEYDIPEPDEWDGDYYESPEEYASDYEREREEFDDY